MLVLFVLLGEAVLLLAGSGAASDRNAGQTPSPSAHPVVKCTAMLPRAEERTTPRHAYHIDPPAGPLPPTLDPEWFAANRPAYVVYAIAARIPGLLYQQPCYCPCDKAEGHTSLLDCYTHSHGTACHICQKGAIFVYEHANAGETAAGIREAMQRAFEKGDLWRIDIDKFAEAYDRDTADRHGRSSSSCRRQGKEIQSVHPPPEN
jgi:hypothetical protein